MGKLIIIAAKGRNNELGYNNHLIWNIKEDLQFFKSTTEYHSIVMGRKTYESLPHILSNRRHIVLTRNGTDFPDEVLVCRDLKELKRVISEIDDDIYIIGGASIYAMFIDLADEMILTDIDDEYFCADAFFPKVHEKEWNSEITHDFKESNPPYLRKVYTRIESNKKDD